MRLLIFLQALLILLGSPLAAAADNPDKLQNGGKFGLALRWRFETVDQDPLPHDASDAPLRVRLNYTTAAIAGWSAKVEFDYVSDFGMDHYNAGAGNLPHPAGYPVIADPTGPDWNQAYLQYKTASGYLFRAGRQRLIYDNARFVGNVGWRQNEQTFDALSFKRETGSGLKLQYAYVARVNRIFGDKVAAGNHSQNTHLFNLSIPVQGSVKMTGYFYDIDDEDAAALSSTTWGLRLDGSAAAGGRARIAYGLEYARQRDNADNPADYRANYWRADLSVAFAPASLYAGFESLGGDRHRSGRAFQTPLATLHAFNGWADLFLNTPASGLNDAFIGLKGKAGKWNWNALYHDFSAQSGPADFGTEYDASIGRKFMTHYSILFKAASFDSDGPDYGDTTKLWVMLSADF